MPATIEHVVVLMLENRSFDHMLGYLYPWSNTFEGVDGGPPFFNYADPFKPQAPKYYVNSHARSGDLNRDAGHGFFDVFQQVYGVYDWFGPKPDPPVNGGFVHNYEVKNPGGGSRIMNCFKPATLPILNRLAQEFAVCDHWFSSMPGPTWPNRLFAHTGASDGRVDNEYRFYHDETIYNRLNDAGKTWSFFLQGWITQAMALTRLYSFKKWAFRRLSSFEHLAEVGNLPNYSFIEPRFYRFEGFRAPTDQHPPHDVHRGEQLIADVYKMVRNSPLWEKSMLIITYDEHGGTVDHVHPGPAPKPGATSQNPPFEFDRYGVRVPAVVVSPYIAPNTKVNTVLDHTSILASVRKLFGDFAPLTGRDAAATPVHEAALNLDQPRNDAPLDIRDVIAIEEKVSALESMAVTETAPGAPTAPLNDYQTQLLLLSRELANRTDRSLESVALEVGLPLALTEDVAAREVEQNVRAFLAQE